MTTYAINRYSSSKRPATADPKAANYHANIEAETPEEALRKSKLRTSGFSRNPDQTAGCLHLIGGGNAEIWVRPAVPGTRPR